MIEHADAYLRAIAVFVPTAFAMAFILSPADLGKGVLDRLAFGAVIAGFVGGAVTATAVFMLAIKWIVEG